MTNFILGGHATHRGRLYIVRGITPMGVSTRRVLLEDAETQELLTLDWNELSAAAPDAGESSQPSSNGRRRRQGP